jgi:hypothetical protein
MALRGAFAQLLVLTFRGMQRLACDHRLFEWQTGTRIQGNCRESGGRSSRALRGAGLSGGVGDEKGGTEKKEDPEAAPAEHGRGRMDMVPPLGPGCEARVVSGLAFSFFFSREAGMPVSIGPGRKLAVSNMRKQRNKQILV